MARASRPCSSWWPACSRPSGGSVPFKDREIAGWAAPRSAAPSFVPQERNVFGTMSVARDCLEMVAHNSQTGAPRQRMAAYSCGRQARWAAAHTLSSGQRQILAMAVALTNAPDLLLLDERTAGLSPRAEEPCRTDLLALNKSGEGFMVEQERARGAVGSSARAYVWAQVAPSVREGRPTSPAHPTVRAGRPRLCSNHRTREWGDRMTGSRLS